MTDLYKVFGNPIEHSKSPVIHTAFAESTQQDLIYEKELVDTDGFNEAVQAFISAKGKGLNITVPFKEDAYQRADKLTKRARQAGAVNTFIVDELSLIHI